MDRVSFCPTCQKNNKSLLGHNVYLPKGRPIKANPDLVRELKRRGLTIGKIASRVGVSGRRIFQILQSN